MSENNFKSFDKQLSWNTKFFVLFTTVLVVVSFILDNIEMGVTIASVIALIIVLLVDYYQIISNKYPKLWRAIKLSIVGIIILITILGLIA